MLASRGRWLYCDDQPRVWFSRSELEATEHAPAAPLEEWTNEQILAAMMEAVTMRADIMEVCTERQ
jgi:hypothetical protein